MIHEREGPQKCRRVSVEPSSNAFNARKGRVVIFGAKRMENRRSERALQSNWSMKAGIAVLCHVGCSRLFWSTNQRIQFHVIERRGQFLVQFHTYPSPAFRQFPDFHGLDHCGIFCNLVQVQWHSPKISFIYPFRESFESKLFKLVAGSPPNIPLTLQFWGEGRRFCLLQ